MLWDAIQLFDDVADADPITRDDLDTVIWATLVAMPSNPFFAHNAAVLLPVVGAMILKWQASDKVERAGHASAQSYMWRAGFYDVVLMTVQLVHGGAIDLIGFLIPHLILVRLEVNHLDSIDCFAVAFFVQLHEY